MKRIWGSSSLSAGLLALLLSGCGSDGSNGMNGTPGANGANGLAALVTLNKEPAGSICPGGGTQINSGLDANGDDVLEPGEITLTPREHEIACAVAGGLSSKAIGARLDISEHTVRKHRENIARKLGLRNAAELVAWAIRHSL